MADKFDFGGDVDRDAFGQILEIDEDDFDFSRPLYEEFCEQAQQQLWMMEEDLQLESSKRDKRLATFAKQHPQQIAAFLKDHQSDQSSRHLAEEESRLHSLSNAGHFLKGSSSTLGLTKVQKGCTKIQHFGKHKDEEGNESDASNEVLFSRLETEVLSVTSDFYKVKARLDKFFGVGNA